MPQPNKIIWYPDEIVYLVKNFHQHTARELLEHINANRKKKIHIHSLRIKCCDLSLIKNERYTEWLERETVFLLQNYQNIGNVEICRILNQFEDRSRFFIAKTIWKKMQLLGIKRCPVSIQTIKSRNTSNGSYKKSQLICASKRLYPEGKKVIRTISGRKYYYCKHNGKMVAYHRLVFKLNFGTIPAGHKIYFKDGNSLNCSPDNLICSKSRFIYYRSRICIPAVFFEKEAVNKKQSSIHEFIFPERSYYIPV